MAERSVIVSREAIRLWVNRFGKRVANFIRSDRWRVNDKWQLDDALFGSGLFASHEIVVQSTARSIGFGARLTRMEMFLISSCKHAEMLKQQRAFSKDWPPGLVNLE